MNPFNIKINKHWNNQQKKRFKQLSQDPNAIIAYWNSDQYGLPCNGGSFKDPVYPGLIQEIRQKIIPCKRGFHASDKPYRWQGKRVWVVAISGEKFPKNINDIYKKIVGSKREFIGEIKNNESDLLSVKLITSNEFSKPLSKEEIHDCDIFSKTFYNECIKNIKLSNINFNNCFFIDCNLPASLKNCGFYNCYFLRMKFENDENELYFEKSAFIDSFLSKNFKKSCYDCAFFDSKRKS